ncbi:MAG TPA: sigma-70 family RNA polymerase sigma factor [Steroidobacteraceae bacterium]
MSQPSDTSEELLSRALAGEAPAFGELVRAQQRSVYSLALRMLGNRQKAEDLAQEVFLQLHRNLAAIESAAHLGFWLRRVTANRAIDRLRREPRAQMLPLEAADGVADEAEGADPLLMRQLRVLVGELPPTPRAVVLLRYQEDLDPTDIARALSMSIHTVKSHLKRSLAALRKGIDAAAQDEVGSST